MRLAVYDSGVAAPRIQDVRTSTPDEMIESLSSLVYDVARSQGGDLPYTVVREIVENLIHADFNETVVSVLDNGSIVRFADQGPGIPHKDRALMPGFTTASHAMKQLIRGVGSGLPLVKEYLEHQGGSLSIEDNLCSGTVVTVTSRQTVPQGSPDRVVPGTHGVGVEGELSLSDRLLEVPALPRMSTRHKKVLSLLLELGEVGPTLVSKELSVGLSTAYRDLSFLETHGLIESDAAGKRVLTDLGSTCLDSLFA